MKKILLVVGSLRKKSFNKRIAVEIENYLSNVFDISYLDFSNIPYMNQDFESPVLESILNIRKIFLESDGIIFITPEYNGSVPGLLKNLMDWLSRPLDETVINDRNKTALYGKKVFVTGVGGKNMTKGAREELIRNLSFNGAIPFNETIGFVLPVSAWKTDEYVMPDDDKNKLIDLIDKFTSTL